jgi:hypothetical protein
MSKLALGLTVAHESWMLDVSGEQRQAATGAAEHSFNIGREESQQSTELNQLGAAIRNLYCMDS